VLQRVGVFVPIFFSEEQNSCTTDGEDFTTKCAIYVVEVMVRAGDALQHIYLIYDCFLHFFPL
jgi:hypothetical protein